MGISQGDAMSLQNLMERQFGASKLYWGVAVSGQLALLLVVLWFSLIGAGPRTSLWLGTIVFLLPVVTFLSKRKATRHYRQGESLRRAYLFLQTMGKKPGNALTICAHADSPVFAFSSPEVVGEYYATVLPEGHKKLVEAVLESAFYTRSIANFASIACGVMAFIGTVVSILVLWLTISVRSSAPSSFTDAVARLFPQLFGFFAVGLFAELWSAYQSLSLAAEKAVTKCESLLIAQSESAEILSSVGDYDCALAAAPPLPGTFKKLLNARLQKAWSARHSLASTGGLGPAKSL